MSDGASKLYLKNILNKIDNGKTSILNSISNVYNKNNEIENSVNSILNFNNQNKDLPISTTTNSISFLTGSSLKSFSNTLGSRNYLFTYSSDNNYSDLKLNSSKFVYRTVISVSGKSLLHKLTIQINGSDGYNSYGGIWYGCGIAKIVLGTKEYIYLSTSEHKTIIDITTNTTPNFATLPSSFQKLGTDDEYVINLSKPIYCPDGFKIYTSIGTLFNNEHNMGNTSASVTGYYEIL